MTQQAQYIEDPDDFCRLCSGTGVLREKTERGTMSETCWACGGSKKKCVRVEARTETQV